MYGKGISREGSLLDVGVDLDLVKKSGAWYTYDGEQLGQGRENAKLFLAEHPEVMVEISERIRSQLGIGASGGLVDNDGDGGGDGGSNGNGKTAVNGDAHGNEKTGANGKTTNGDGTLSLDEPITLDD
jgi:hypothetical protein